MPTMTAAQRRAAAKADYDAFIADCPSRQLLDRIAHNNKRLGPGPRGPGEFPQRLFCLSLALAIQECGVGANPTRNP